MNTTTVAENIKPWLFIGVFGYLKSESVFKILRTLKIKPPEIKPLIYFRLFGYGTMMNDLQ